MRTRFAPSPTGYLHVGHAFSAILNHKIGKEFLLRIEDIDSTRSRHHFQTAILEDLKWLDCKPCDEILYQQQRLHIYKSYLDHLIELDLVYPCFCSRKEVQSSQILPSQAQQKQRKEWQIDTPIYSGTCRNITTKERLKRMHSSSYPYTWRLDANRLSHEMPLLYFEDIRKGKCLSDLSLFGDVALARVDEKGMLHIGYHLACTIDDELQKIDLIIRGVDLLSSTIIHRYLQYIFSFSTPLYFHHDLLLDENKRKLSKRDHATSLASMRENGWSAVDLYRHLEPQLAQHILCITPDYYSH